MQEDKSKIGFKKAKLFQSKIWEWKEHNRNAEWINNTRIQRRPSSNNALGIAWSKTEKGTELKRKQAMTAYMDFGKKSLLSTTVWHLKCVYA